jgi:hypothetical protein
MAVFGAIAFVVLVAMLFLRLVNPFGWPDDLATAAMRANGSYPLGLTLSLSFCVASMLWLLVELRKLHRAKRHLGALKAELALMQRSRARKVRQERCNT